MRWNVVVAACTAMVALVSLGFMIDAGTWLDKDEWAALGQWAGGIGSAAAVIVALWIAHRDWTRARTAEAAEHQAQALLVLAEVVDKEIRVTNHGSRPVLRLVVPRLYWPGGGIRADRHEFAPPVKSILLPGGTWNAPLPNSGTPKGNMLMIMKMLAGGNGVSAELRWTDSHGNHWARRGEEAPRLMAESDWTRLGADEVVREVDLAGQSPSAGPRSIGAPLDDLDDDD
ncbi:hypothetical protein [Actinosynnema sp. NPDC023587]|uniref:hypothetical protein n=1 Tax=Actinosynnema sp. NPDC023587 TaxID=3154695 RepID=UPI0033F433EE